MSKTTFVDGDPSQGILGTIVLAAFLNALNSHGHSGADEDGCGGLLGVSKGCHDFANLEIKNNVSAPTTQVDINADGGILFDANNRGRIITDAIDLTVDITASGANGLDTGTEDNVWYYLWIIAKADGTVAGLISASAASPTLPTGYTFKALVGAILNSSDDFINIFQAGAEVNRDAIIVLNGGTSEATSPCASVGSFASALPPTAKGPLGTVYNANVNGNVSFGMSTDCLLGRIAAGTIERVSMSGMLFAGSQTMYYVVDPTGASAFVEVSGWRY